MEDEKGYATVYWGKMPINFRPRDFPEHEVQGAVGRAERSSRDVLDLVPNFSVLTLRVGPDGGTEAVLVLGDGGEERVVRRARQEDGSLDGLLWEISLRVRSRCRRRTGRERTRTG